MNHFALEYFGGVITSLIPFSLGTLLIVLSPLINDKSEGLSVYGKIIGIIVSILSGLMIVYNFSGMIGQYV